VLFRPELHEQPSGAEWSEARVRDAVAAIVADADAAYDPVDLWPAHEWDGWSAALPLKNLYVGAAGVVWGLDALRRRGYAETTLPLAEAAEHALRRWQAEPDFVAGLELPVPPEAGLLTGDTGILVVAWRLAPSGERADELLDRVRRNVANEAEEIMWGAPGTLLAASAMADWTGEERWRAAARETAEALWARQENGWWTVRLYGEVRLGLSPPHGLAGNVVALRPHLDDSRLAELLGGAAVVLAGRAVHEDGRVSWPSADGEPRLQWCAGAPGIVIHAADYLDEEVLLPAAELVWEAGPFGAEKGAGICHGTAGNGYALLRMFEHTGDARWLARARVFAMHALAQVASLPGRYSLWTGGVGAALFAADCAEGRARYPILDGFD